MGLGFAHFGLRVGGAGALKLFRIFKMSEPKLLNCLEKTGIEWNRPTPWKLRAVVDYSPCEGSINLRARRFYKKDLRSDPKSLTTA